MTKLKKWEHKTRFCNFCKKCCNFSNLLENFKILFWYFWASLFIYSSLLHALDSFPLILSSISYQTSENQHFAISAKILQFFKRLIKTQNISLTIYHSLKIKLKQTNFSTKYLLWASFQWLYNRKYQNVMFPPNWQKISKSCARSKFSFTFLFVFQTI